MFGVSAYIHSYLHTDWCFPWHRVRLFRWTNFTSLSERLSTRQGWGWCSAGRYRSGNSSVTRDDALMINWLYVKLVASGMAMCCATTANFATTSRIHIESANTASPH
jgi:hypothetical protein